MGRQYLYSITLGSFSILYVSFIQHFCISDCQQVGVVGMFFLSEVYFGFSFGRMVSRIFCKVFIINVFY